MIVLLQKKRKKKKNTKFVPCRNFCTSLDLAPQCNNNNNHNKIYENYGLYSHNIGCALNIWGKERVMALFVRRYIKACWKLYIKESVRRPKHYDNDQIKLFLFESHARKNEYLYLSVQVCLMQKQTVFWLWTNDSLLPFISVFSGNGLELDHTLT